MHPRSLRTYSFAITCALLSSFGASAQGDFCSTAVPVTPGTYSADGPSTGGGAIGLCSGASFNSDWYSYTASGNGTWTVGSCLDGEDTNLQVYSGDCTSLVCIGSSDDQCGLSSEVAGLTAVAGQTYYIEWDDFWTTAGFQWYLNFDCANAPSGTETVDVDCANGTFTINVTVTDLGSANDVNITNNGGAPDVNAVGLGTYTIGPFPINTIVVYSLVNTQEPGCDFFSPGITNTIICPVLVICGDPPLHETYCYDNNDDHSWHWQSSDGVSPLAMVWNQGEIESVSFDHLTIYDGPDDQSTPLYDHIDFNTEDLTGLLVVSTGPDIFMHMFTDGSVSCGDGFFQSWDWEIGCLDCTVPGATYTVVPDCPHRQYNVEVTVTSTGDATDVDIVNSLNSDTIQNVGLGTYTIGPFGNDTAVVVTVLNGLNSLCRQNSPPTMQTDSACVYGTCSQLDTYCYANNDEAWFVYQAASPGPITVEFMQGEMLLGDKVVVYNGFDDLSALLFNGNNGGDMTGLAVNSINPDNALAIRVIGDASGSCVGGQVDEDLIWLISCGAVNIDEEPTGEDFLLYPNPTQGVLNIGLNLHWTGHVQVTVMDLSGRTVLNASMVVTGGAYNSIDLSTLSKGNYAVQLTTERWTKTKQIEVLH